MDCSKLWSACLSIIIFSFFQLVVASSLQADTWSSGNKQIFGTSYEAYDSELNYSEQSPTAPISRVWFTGARGVLTEVYWPTLDTAQIRDSQFLVTDGKSFFIEERKDLETHAEWVEMGVPAFRVINTDIQKRFQIEKVIFTDPSQDVVIQKIKIKKNIPGLKFFILHNPSVGNTPYGDSARATSNGLYAWQGTQAQALLSTLPFRKVTAGYSGQSNDGYQDIKSNFKLDSHDEFASNGDVVLTAEFDTQDTVGEENFVIGIGFSSSIHDAKEQVRRSFKTGVRRLLEQYTSQWEEFQRRVQNLASASTDRGMLFRSSVALIQSMQDKTFSGAFVASPTIPWGEHTKDTFDTPIENRKKDSNMTCGYHCVWPRDLYHMATGMIAIGEVKTAIASLNYLKKIQFSNLDGTWEFGYRKHSKEGSFPQNVWINGDIHWEGLQLDQTAYPIILASKLVELHAIQIDQYWDMVKRAADFISDMGPWTHQDRWEEVSGASPSTLAAEIAALYAAQKIAVQMGDRLSANRYGDLANLWSSKTQGLESWTFTHHGIYGDGQYFLRVVGSENFYQPWNPDDNSWLEIANGGGRWQQKEILDGGFLELVRLGIRMPNDESILKTLVKYDELLGRDLLGFGRSYYRYTHDSYNRDDLDGRSTSGMLWPLLTGERGFYEAVKKNKTDKYISSMENFSNETKMLPEQVWDSGQNIGTSTGSATPLGWAHAEYIQLLKAKYE